MFSSQNERCTNEAMDKNVRKTDPTSLSEQYSGREGNLHGKGNGEVDMAFRSTGWNQALDIETTDALLYLYEVSESDHWHKILNQF